MSSFKLLNVNEILKEDISKVTAADIPVITRYSDNELKVKFFSLERIVNSIGKSASLAQGTVKAVTTLEKLYLSPNHTLYILKDASGNKGAGEVTGILKVGKKKLYLDDKQGKLVIATLLCILDFYVVESRQRRGLGKKLYDYMLQDQKIKPYELALDGPSTKILNFLQKYYELTKVIENPNKYVVFKEFFEAENMGAIRPQVMEPAPRASCQRWNSGIGAVIHGGLW